MVVDLDNTADAAAGVTVKNDLYLLKADGSRGRAVASLSTDGLTVPAHASAASESQVVIPSPIFWTLEKPRRYLWVTSVQQDGRTVDACETPFGIRTAVFTAMAQTAVSF